MQKILLALKFKEDNQHNKIFRTRGTINDKVCNVIIDSGSSENIVSKTLVDVMGILIKKCPTPYKIEWIKKGTEMRVTGACRITFSIKKIYKSDIVCDIVDMHSFKDTS